MFLKFMAAIIIVIIMNLINRKYYKNKRLNKQEKYQYSSRIYYANCIENEIEKAKKYGWEVIDGPKFAYYLKGVNSIGENPTGAYYSVLLRKKKKT